MGRVIGISKLSSFLLAAHSLHSCASSPSPDSLQSFIKPIGRPVNNALESATECPWGPMAMHGWRSDGTSHMFALAEKNINFEGQVSKILGDSNKLYMPHMILLVTNKKNPSEEFIVHVGPGWYLEQQGIKINTDDIITIIGRVLNSDERSIFATSIKKKNKTVNLRDQMGRPAWARGPQMRP
jgi:hypothetical protein